MFYIRSSAALLRYPMLRSLGAWRTYRPLRLPFLVSSSTGRTRNRSPSPAPVLLRIDNINIFGIKLSSMCNFLVFFVLCSKKAESFLKNGGEEGIRTLVGCPKRFSRPPRYDHFDTSPYVTKIFYHKDSKKST